MPFLTSLSAKLLAAVVAGLVLLAAGAYGGYRWELGTYEARIAADATALTKATQAAAAKQLKIDAANQTAAMADAQAQQVIVTKTVTLTKEIPIYVHDTIACPGLTVGLARVLRAASAGIDPASLNLAAGQSDDACSDVAPSEVAGWLTDYAGAAIANAQQLNDLETAVRANDALAQ